jgi:hypothetical protein
VEPTEFTFRIDAFTPDTLPMARLAEYLAALAKLLGHQEHTHFVRVEPGSARLVHKVDAVDVPKVESRLHNIRAGDAPRDALVARQALEDLLANDNALGSLFESETGRVVVPFVGRDRPKVITFPPFREDTTIQGQIVNIGGRDATAHATLQDGDAFHVNVSMKRDLAREMAKLLYGPTVRLHGNGRFERQNDGVWKMLDFKVDRYSILEDKTVAETLAVIRQVPGNSLMAKDGYSEILAVRDDDADRTK